MQHGLNYDFVNTPTYSPTDIDECFDAAMNSIELCLNNTVCVNNLGSYLCSCVSGYSLVNGTCIRKIAGVISLHHIAHATISIMQFLSTCTCT